MTRRQQRFAEEYILDLNATKAAIRAGFSAATANRAGSRLLSNVEIQAEIARLQEERSRRIGLQADQVLEELAIIAFSDVNHYSVGDDGKIIVDSNATFGATRAIKSKKYHVRVARNGTTLVEAGFQLWDKLKALELCMKHLGMDNTGGELDLEKFLRLLGPLGDQIRQQIVDPKSGLNGQREVESST
jgi:phage terminase small subunit